MECERMCCWAVLVCSRLEATAPDVTRGLRDMRRAQNVPAMLRKLLDTKATLPRPQTRMPAMMKTQCETNSTCKVNNFGAVVRYKRCSKPRPLTPSRLVGDNTDSMTGGVAMIYNTKSIEGVQ